MSRLFSAIVATFFAPVSFAQSAPEPGQVHIDHVVYAGSGCPVDSVAYNLSPDRKAFTLLFDSFDLATGSNGRREKKHCAIDLRLNVPAGWAYTLFSIDYRGFADLPRGAESRLRAWYSIGASEEIRISNLKMKAPFSNDYHMRAGVPLDALPWQDCSESQSSIRINTELMVDGKEALMTVDTVDGEMSQTYGIAWKRCSKSSSWVSNCRVEMETVWGTNMATFRAVGYGSSHENAKSVAENDALAQCEIERQKIARPLIRAMTECRTHTHECTAVPQ